MKNRVCICLCELFFINTIALVPESLNVWNLSIREIQNQATASAFAFANYSSSSWPSCSSGVPPCKHFSTIALVSESLNIWNLSIRAIQKQARSRLGAEAIKSNQLGLNTHPFDTVLYHLKSQPGQI
ncbi:hypothetical protein CROQUDRAFT_94634 [Cronartium quercuum f. sp. fusiforme G11]|uniref:Uncharacterized protein n=1 Tax=Cronartium quercuum f. sp. fusiforme G11 TaxID=708437 RepID=A0A9P6NFW0_9BASI|nr:hypothetical protein CROQUDRAFT_94634 [Cronartium quercuum f. sp. fusiforme G11]